MQNTPLLMKNLRDRISAIEALLRDLKQELWSLENRKSFGDPFGNLGPPHPGSCPEDGFHHAASESQPGDGKPLRNFRLEEYQRYGRQMIMPEVGMAGQTALKEKSVLIIGLGGLGCPAAAYLGAAGVGRIGLVDGDTVEISNLHRQILHTSNNVGMLKVNSAAQYLKSQNPNVICDIYPQYLSPENAVELFEKYSLIFDCSDRPVTRYLISDAAVIAHRPLISASALKTEGQLMVLNNPPALASTNQAGGFCYRCVFPKPPPAESVTTCGEGGILGPVVGVMGVLMATEGLKVLLTPANGEQSPDNPDVSNTRPSLLLYSAFSQPLFRSVRLKGKRSGCPSCSDSPSIGRDSLESGSLDYAAFCGMRQPINVLHEDERISAVAYNKMRCSSPLSGDVLIDVREKIEFDIAHLERSINIPYSTIKTSSTADMASLVKQISEEKDDENGRLDGRTWVFICRFGNDSQLAVEKFKAMARHIEAGPGSFKLRDVRGGLKAWRQDVDPEFPNY